MNTTDSLSNKVQVKLLAQVRATPRLLARGVAIVAGQLH